MNMKKRSWKVVELECNGLKCDALGCGWKDTKIPVKDFKYFVGKNPILCPNCRARVLSDSEYRLIKRISFGLGIINLFFGWRGLFKNQDFDKIAEVYTNGPGDGRIKRIEVSVV